ncbi:phosphoglycerol geranylgeranyltransferase [Aestuariibaculum lutulentum]|uniref:Geranylgeranylglyceryl phosphate synthase n=1 Tax=Aestuariibaculum lutulentum TaxID=2920935 RepID=A0ABS9RFW9_9FLAO|nr:geranylgeranylglyceryl/heptaprenylglyceryl phosphate synthase [Aestuariibaculum lutulentum]MCH4551848.1 geranylgeranylglyceryl/heptaprenylglyceryl phosphate synthase [Aestuariibaculum lutulentum]
MKTVYKDIFSAIDSGKKLLAILIDPDKFAVESVPEFITKVNASVATHIFVGGSTVEDDATHILVEAIKTYTSLPVVLFPGDVTQITPKADALLFLSLISGRNADYLIGKHVASVSRLRGTNLEVIPTGYLLIENGKETAVQRVTGTNPIPRIQIENIVDTAKAGELLGMKLIYLEAGSGAVHPITSEIITSVKTELNIPLIVGGGIRSKEQLQLAYNSGADMVVIGTAFEQDELFFNDLSN